jgi:MOSC domain-containing protein YiiM
MRRRDITVASTSDALWDARSYLISRGDDAVIVDGDARADLALHGDPSMAVYGYPADHYRSWTTEFDLRERCFGFVGATR